MNVVIIFLSRHIANRIAEQKNTPENGVFEFNCAILANV